MRKSIDRKKIIRRTLQSLPISLAAIVVVMYGLSFVPSSTDDMAKSVAVVERRSFYEISQGGKAVAWFREIGDSIEPQGLSASKDSEATQKATVCGFWVNRYPLLPSCRGRMIIAATTDKSLPLLSKADKEAQALVAKGINTLERKAKRLTKKADELKYYLSVHNVSDQGYNAMAAYEDKVAMAKNEADKLVATLRQAQEKGQLKIRHKVEYALIYKDEDGKVRRKVCRDITAKGGTPFRVIQTEDEEKPEGAVALYPHYRMMPTPKVGDTIMAAAYPAMSQVGFSLGTAKATVFPGTIGHGRRHDMPRMFAPDGAPVFSQRGFFIGISLQGGVATATELGFGLNKLLR